jgi:hypothetical protein
MSYTEFEFQVASDAGLVRLIFLVGEDSDGPATFFHDPIFGARQDRFRKRFRDSGLTVARVTSPGELEAALLHALLALPRPRDNPRHHQRPSDARCFYGRSISTFASNQS